MKLLPALRGLAALTLLCCFASAAHAEDGYDLWLRYRPVEKVSLGKYQAAATALVTAGTSLTIRAARDELARGLGGLLLVCDHVHFGCGKAAAAHLAHLQPRAHIQRSCRLL